MKTIQHAVPAWLAILIAVYCHVSVAAQEWAPGDDARFQHGPLRLTPTVALRNLGADSNVFNEVDAEHPESDFTATLTPAAAMWLNLGRLRLASHHSMDLVYFHTHSDQRSTGTSHDVRLEAPLTRVTPWVSAGMLSTRDRPGYEIDVRARRVENTLGAGADWNPGGRTSVSLGVRRNALTFEPDERFAGTWLRQILDRRVESLDLIVRRKLTPLTTLAVLTSHGRERFVFFAIRDGDSLRLTPGLEFDSRIRGSVRIGYRQTNFLSPLMPDFSGLVASADVSYDVLSGTKVDLGATRDLVYSYEVEQPYYVQAGFNGTVTQHLVSVWDVQGRLARQRLTYQRQVDGARADGGVDRISTAGVGVGYHLSTDVRLGLNLDLHRRRSHTALRDYQRRTIGASLTYGF